MIFKYNLYGMKILSNISFDFLQKVDIPDCSKEVRIVFTVKKIRNRNKIEMIYLNKNQINLYIGSIAEYNINFDDNIIYCYGENQSSITSTLFNLPFCIYCAVNDIILLHCSGFVYNNEVYSLTGPKGSGKSTMILHISEYLPFFSDDVIAVDNEMLCYSGNYSIKIYDEIFETKEFNNVEDVKERNLLGKKVLIVNNRVSSPLKISKIFSINRCESSKIFKERISLEKQKELMLLNSIVGLNVLGSEYLEIIKNTSTFAKLMKNIDLYNLYIEDNLKKFSNNFLTILDTIIGEK